MNTNRRSFCHCGRNDVTREEVTRRRKSYHLERRGCRFNLAVRVYATVDISLQFSIRSLFKSRRFRCAKFASLDSMPTISQRAF